MEKARDRNLGVEIEKKKAFIERETARLMSLEETRTVAKTATVGGTEKGARRTLQSDRKNTLNCRIWPSTARVRV